MKALNPRDTGAGMERTIGAIEIDPEPTSGVEKPVRVMKVGGSCLDDAEFIGALGAGVRRSMESGDRPVLVHGGGPDIADLHERLKLPVVFREGLRVTDEEGLDLAVMALCGRVNKRLVAAMIAAGIPAVGISGVDMGTLRAKVLDRERFGAVGTDPAVETMLLRTLMEQGSLPVLAPIGLGPSGELLNVNADTAAHSVASALRAETLDFVTDTPGVLVDGRVHATLHEEEMDGLIEEGVVHGGMIPKLEAARSALRGGVERVRIGNLETLAANTATEAVPAGGS